MPWQLEAGDAASAAASTDGFLKQLTIAAFATCDTVVDDYCTNLVALAGCCINLLVCLLSGCRKEEPGCFE